MTKILTAIVGIALLAGCAPTTQTAPTSFAPRNIGDGVRIGGCPRINIGTPEAPRTVVDPACSTRGGRG